MTEQTPPLPVLTERPPYFIAGLVALGALLLYVATIAPTTQFWDSSEYMAAAHALGIPHRRALVAPHRAASRPPLGTAARGRGRGAGRRHWVHRVEPVGGEREGLHGERAVDRTRAVARRALGRPDSPP